ncbi:IPT/TIG domain-containing protein [Flindersiella endophytica]
MKMLSKRILVVTCVLAVGLVSCGRDSPGDTFEAGSKTTSPAPATTGADSPDDEDDNGNSNGKDSNSKDEEELPWVPIGPAGPDIPEDERWYTRLVNRECNEVGPGSDESAEGLALLYRGLGTACSALFDKQTGRWGNAQRDLTRALDQLADENLECHNGAAVALGRRLLEFPDGPPGLRITSTRGTVCPWGIDDIDPAQGTVQGGTTVEIYDDSGNGLQDVTEVLFGQSPAEIVARDDPDDDKDNYRSIQVISPRASNAGAVQITVRSPGGSRTGVSFEYVDDEGEEQDSNDEETTPPDDGPTPTPSDTTGETG